MPDLLRDFDAWTASEIRYAARESFLADWWERLEWFMEEMNTKGSEIEVYPLLRLALKHTETPELALAYLKRAKTQLEEQASHMVPDEYIRSARDDYLTQAEVNRKWNGVEA